MEALEKALAGIELTEDEWLLVEWISKWDRTTITRFVSIIKKCRESQN